jgi:FkbM family methyltransferase
VTSPFEIAYGQNAEDVVLHRALKDVEKGFYIEVGANDPTVLSISRPFYDAGWRGIEIEPVEALAERFRQERPRDLVVQAAITAADTDRVSLHAIDGTGLSTLDGAISERHSAAGFESREVTVPARSLDDVLENADTPEDIHFMVVDTEGTEADVLASIDLTRWRPWVLVIEATEPLTTTPSHHSWEPRVLEAGYELCLFDGISRFYVADEHAERLRHQLSYPPTVLDGYTPYHWHRREQEFAHLRARHEEVLEQLIRWRGTVLARWNDAVGASTGSVGGAANHEVVRLREELAATRATVSWRITAPLRAVQERRIRGWR